MSKENKCFRCMYHFNSCQMECFPDTFWCLKINKQITCNEHYHEEDACEKFVSKEDAIELWEKTYEMV